MIRHIIFDLDDTLIACGKYYLEQKRAFAKDAAARTGLPEAFCHSILQKVDLECTHLPHGWGRERFPKSFAAVSLALDVIAGKPIDVTASEQAYLLGETVFSAPYELLPFTKSVLRRLKDDGIELYLFTKGDYQIQQQKILSHSLLEYVGGMDRVYIVPTKTGAQLEQIVTDHKLNVNECLLVGDSMRDDIASANEIGMRAILVKTGYAWAYETHDASPFATLRDLSELPPLVALLQEQLDYVLPC